MPAISSLSRNSSLNRFRLTVLFLFFPLFFFGQTLTGLWTGALSNDSTTVRKDQLFEIALTEYRGKVYGYSRSEFIVNDTLYYIVKRVKGTIVGDVCEVTDDDIIAYNFRGKLDKGIKVTSTFRRNGSDSSWYLAGNWKTNATKKYYSVTGKVDLEQEKDLTASKIFPHLEELKLTKDIAFYKERNEVTPVVKIAKPEKIKTEYSVNLDPGTTDIAVAPKPVNVEISSVVVQEEPEEKLPEIRKPDGGLPKTETKDVATTAVAIKPSLNNKTAAINKPAPVVPQEKTPVTTTTETVKTPAPVTTTPATQNKPVVSEPVAKNNTPRVNTTAPAQNKPAAVNTVAKTATASNNNVAVVKTETNPVTQKTNPAPATSTVSAPVAKIPAPEPKKSVEELTQKVASIAGRKSEFTQVVNFKSDSLLLSLYDNGEIDGDTVSVIMNGDVIMAKQGLKASAIRKTIYIKPGQDEDFTLVLFAENLGKYPPNTGLLVVHDGEDTYHLRFSSDFQKSSGIVFRRNK